jgi:hypothetical protein
LHSLSSAVAKLFLDFDGDAGGTWNGFTVPSTPAYDQDGDASTYSTTELSSIQQIWARVAEKYSPFNIDVTTDDPGNRNDLQTAAVVIGGNGAWYGTAGGTSEVNGFSRSARSNTAYVFPSQVGNSVKNVAEASAHEAGHLFGLQHQSIWSGSTLVQPYNPGTAAAAPVMGSSYNAIRGLWWYGTSSVSSSSMQDDVAVISSGTNGFGYRSDDHGNASGTATALSGSSPAALGIISQTSDSDYFSFGTTGGQLSFTADIATYGGMLDLKLSLYNSSGGLVTSADSSSLGESISATVSAGTYYLVVASHGSYGDVGQYSLSGTVPWDRPSQVRQPTAPTGTLASTLISVADGATATVLYTASTAIDTGTIDDGDLQVVGSNGYTGTVSVLAQQSSAAGSSLLVTYQLLPPTERWTSSANGLYQITLLANEVSDLSGLSAPMTQLGSLEVNIAPPIPSSSARRRTAAPASPAAAASSGSGAWSAIESLLSHSGHHNKSPHSA